MLKESRSEITIRMAEPKDVKELLAVYAPYVENTAVTFEYHVPDVREFGNRMQKVMEKYPYLVAEKDGRIAGYTYASPFKERDAYDWSVETTIYINQNLRGYGIGKKLYETLEKVLKRQNIMNLNACIAFPNPESIGFHEHMGYKTVAHFTKCGYKRGKWYDMVWMEKMLGDHPKQPPVVLPVKELGKLWQDEGGLSLHWENEQRI